MRVAVVHDYLDQYGGAERVLEAMLEIFPGADLYTTIYHPDSFPEESLIEQGRTQKRWGTGQRGGRVLSLNMPRVLGKCGKALSIWYPFVFERYDFSGYNLIISSSSNFAKGVITAPGTTHISYIHTPPRFLYGYSTESNWRSRPVIGSLARPIDAHLRVWDYHAAQRIDKIVTNSQNVAKRVWKYYRREAVVIYPPVVMADKVREGVFPGGQKLVCPKRYDRSKIATPEEGDAFNDRSSRPLVDSYYLVVSRLSKYKNIDLVVQAAALLPGLQLEIVGVGPELERLRAIAEEMGVKDRVRFLGFVEDAALMQLYDAATAVICPTRDEDFGIVPVEAMAMGTPVIALRSGGYKETILEGETGFFFEEPTAGSLVEALRSKKGALLALDSRKIQQYAYRFSKARFQEEFKNLVEDVLESRNAGATRS